MARKSRKPLERHHVHLYEGDWHRLQSLYGDTVGAAGAIRELIHSMLNRIEVAAAERRKIDKTELDINDLVDTEPNY